MTDRIVDVVERQLPQIQRAADWFAASIAAGRMVHVFASGHSRIMVEEMWPRYGSFPGFNPIVELSLTFHNLVIGANGQRQAMFLENVSGLAERICRNFAFSDVDSALVISSPRSRQALSRSTASAMMSLPTSSFSVMAASPSRSPSPRCLRRGR